MVQVAVTPNGYADGIAIKMPENKEYFVMPEEQIMSMAQFLDHLDHKEDSIICYIQQQNSNLSRDYSELHDDIDLSTLQFALEAFNKDPDAINFWMGDERAITSLHKDPYENMYTVISGYKDFILIPPIDLPYVPRFKYPSANYKTNKHNNELVIEPLVDGKFISLISDQTNEFGNFSGSNKPIDIEWVSIDPLQPNSEKFPSYAKATKYEIRINAGDMLYLPSLWYHNVRQSHKCIAVNFWYDMEYDARYCYYKMMEKLCGFGYLAHPSPS